MRLEIFAPLNNPQLLANRNRLFTCRNRKLVDLTAIPPIGEERMFFPKFLQFRKHLLAMPNARATETGRPCVQNLTDRSELFRFPIDPASVHTPHQPSIAKDILAARRQFATPLALLLISQ